MMSMMMSKRDYRVTAFGKKFGMKTSKLPASPRLCAEMAAAYDSNLAAAQQLMRQRSRDDPFDESKPEALAFVPVAGVTLSRLSSAAQPVAGVTLSRSGSTAQADEEPSVADDRPAVAHCDRWMRAGRKALVWRVTFDFREIQSDMCIGIIGRNYLHPSNWHTRLDSSKHAVVVRCGDGAVFRKGQRVHTLVLRPLPAKGCKLRLTLDQQALELNLEVLGEERGSVLGALVVDALDTSEVTPAIGFANDGGPQSVRILSCTSEAPILSPSTRGRPSKAADLWDDDNVVQPLHFRPTYKDLLSHAERAPLHAERSERIVSSYS